MTIHVSGIDLYYEVHGTGAPLLLIHGNGEDHTIFDKAVEVLKEHFTCYCIDSRGHGRSTKVEHLDYDVMARDLLEFMEQLDLKEVNYYGFSDGGNIGLILARLTNRLANMIISGTVANPQGCKAWMLAIIRIMYFFTRDPKLKMMLEEPQITDAQLQQIKVRTLVLAGQKDVVRESHTRHIAQMIEGSALKILPGEGHGSYIVHSTKIAELIRDFIGSSPC